jgi:hypothetical protein
MVDAQQVKRWWSGMLVEAEKNFKEMENKGKAKL